MAGASAAKSGPGVPVAQIDQVSQLGVPQISPTFRRIWRRLLAVMRMERAANAVDADPVAGTLVAQPRTPAAGALPAAVGRAAHSVRAGSGNLQDSGATVEGRVEGDYLVADDPLNARLQNLEIRPKSTLWTPGMRQRPRLPRRRSRRSRQAWA